jgi:transcriptional/translational regulatory protein YebC/TACO1
VLVSASGADEDELTLAAAEGGADDVSLDGSTYEVVSAPEALTAVREAIEGAGFAVDSAELTMRPKTTVEGRGRKRSKEDSPPDRPARGERRRAGRLRELRHPPEQVLEAVAV